MFAHVLSLVTSLSLPGLLVGLVFASVSLLTFAIMRAVLVRSEIKRRTLLPILATSQDARSLRHSETIAEEMIAIATTMPNSLNTRPTTPPISRIGMKTAINETDMEMMV